MSILVRLVMVVVRAFPARLLASGARVLFSKTTRQLEASCRDVRTAQQRVLVDILRENASTTFGVANNFGAISGVDGFRQSLPISTWEDMAADVDRMVAGEKNVRVSEDPIFYATTSGTTGRRKLIPVTSSYVRACRTVARVLFRSTLIELPFTLKGKRLTMRSPDVERLENGALAGSITVALSGGLDESENVLDAVPSAVFRVRDFRTKYFLCLRFALAEDVTTVSAVNPSTLLLFAKTLKDDAMALADALEHGTLAPADFPLVLDDDIAKSLKRSARIDRDAAARIRRSVETHGEALMRDVFPNLSGLMCWKGGSAPYFVSRLQHSYGDVDVLDHGYAASEAVMGAPLSVDGAASLLVPHSHFFEFAGVDNVDDVRAGRASTLLLDELQVGRQYFVFVTTHGGLYRYDMNDVIEVTARHGQAPLVVFRHKGGAMSSLTGEKLSEAHVTAAMTKIFNTKTPLEGFVVAPLLSEPEPGYLVAVESNVDDEALVALAGSFDAALQTVNMEYEAKRTSKRLVPCVVVRLPTHSFSEHRRRRVAAGAPDAHVKIPHLSPDGQLLIDLGIDAVSPERASRLPVRVLK